MLVALFVGLNVYVKCTYIFLRSHIYIFILSSLSAECLVRSSKLHHHLTPRPMMLTIVILFSLQKWNLCYIRETYTQYMR